MSSTRLNVKDARCTDLEAKLEEVLYLLRNAKIKKNIKNMVFNKTTIVVFVSSFAVEGSFFFQPI